MRKEIAAILLSVTALTGLTACSKTIEGTPSPPTASSAPSPTALPEPTPSMDPSPSKPSTPPVYKTYPKVTVKNYKVVYNYMGAWGAYSVEATVRDEKVTEAWLLKKGEAKEKVEDQQVYTLNELLKAADNNPHAKVVWASDLPYPTSIRFDNPDAFDDERTFLVQSFEEIK